MCNLPLGVATDNVLNFELCDIYLAIDNINSKLTEKQIELIFGICAEAALQCAPTVVIATKVESPVKGTTSMGKRASSRSKASRK